MERNRWKASCRGLRSSDSLKLVLTPVCSRLLHSCRWSLQKANTQSTGSEAQGEALAVRRTIWISYCGPLCQEDLSAWLEIADYSFKKAFKLIYFCSYPNQRIMQCSYLFANCSGQSYLQPLRSENEALVTVQTNHKNLINALIYSQPLTWSPACLSSCWPNDGMLTVTQQSPRSGEECWVHAGCLVSPCGY